MRDVACSGNDITTFLAVCVYFLVESICSKLHTFNVAVAYALHPHNLEAGQPPAKQYEKLHERCCTQIRVKRVA